MPKKPRRKNLRPPRKCIFCEGGGIRGNPISEEHLWPEWMHPYLPKLDNPMTDEAYHVIRMKTVVVSTRTKPRQGQTYTRRFKLVCKHCSETWMSRIENDVKSMLIPLLQGRRKSLLREDRIKLARWFVLNAMVIEKENPWPPPDFTGVNRLAHHMEELIRSDAVAWRPLDGA
jgi:hypothetical protein